MRILNTGDIWSIRLETREEATALLEAQASPAGNESMFSTNPEVDRIGPGMRAVELLRFAEITLQSDHPGPESVIFPLEESQHLSALVFSAIRRAKETGAPTTAYDSLLSELDAQIDEYFGMGA